MMYVPCSTPIALSILTIQVFERLQQRADPKVREEQEQAISDRVNAIFQKSQTRLAELVSRSELPVLG